MVRIEIERELCIGYGACAETAPRSLRLAADGKVEAIAELVDDEADVLEAALVCPMSAIVAHTLQRPAA